MVGKLSGQYASGEDGGADCRDEAAEKQGAWRLTPVVREEEVVRRRHGGRQP